MSKYTPVSCRLTLPALAAISLLMAGTAGAQMPAPPSPPAAATPSTQADGVPMLTLRDLVQTVVTHNPGLLASQRSRDSAAAAIRSANARPNPSLEMGTGQNRARLPGANAGAIATWGVAQFIENPRLRQSRIEAAQHAERGQAAQIQLTRSELVAQVRVKAFEYLLRREEAQAAADALALLEQIRERVKLRVDTGEAARYEIIKADAEIINARQKYQTASLQIEQAALSINRLAAGALPARWSLAASLSDSMELSALAEYRAQARDTHPELRALQAEVARREARLDEARASRWPGVELRYSQVRDPEVRQGMLSASVQIPLLDQRSGPQAEAMAELERARTLLDGRRAELDQQVLLAWKAMEVARVRVSALSTGAVREAEAALRVAEAAYRFGERGILDVLDAQRLLRTVRADLLDARYQAQAASVDLDFLAGRYADPASPTATTFQE